MTRVIVDAALRGKLLNLAEPVELCDPDGRVLAHVIPVVNYSQIEPRESPISEEELRRRERADEKRYTTAEVLAQLEKLI